MGRPREFDEGAAVAAASNVFRQKGYAATSVDDLVKATGVHRASLYGVFGSKHGLFLRALTEAQKRPSTDEVLDLYLVALAEVAPSDPTVRQRLADGAGDLTPQTLGARLLARAGLPAATHDATR